MIPVLHLQRLFPATSLLELLVAKVTRLTVKVADIFGPALAGVHVLFLNGNQGFSLSPSFAVTNSSGYAQTSIKSCSANDILEVESGNLPPTYITLT